MRGRGLAATFTMLLSVGMNPSLALMLALTAGEHSSDAEACQERDGRDGQGYWTIMPANLARDVELFASGRKFGLQLGGGLMEPVALLHGAEFKVLDGLGAHIWFFTSAWIQSLSPLRTSTVRLGIKPLSCNSRYAKYLPMPPRIAHSTPTTAKAMAQRYGLFTKKAATS